MRLIFLSPMHPCSTVAAIIITMAIITMMMMIGPKSLANQKEGVQREGEEEVADQRKGGQTRTSLSVRGVRCKEQEKTLTVVWGSAPQEGQMWLGISPIQSRYE